MVEKIAPNLLGPFFHPMRSLLKEMLYEVSFPFHRLDQKIDIEMPAMPKLKEKDFGLLLDALVANRTVLIKIAQQNEAILALPLKLKITSEKWIIQIEIQQTTEVMAIGVNSIESVKAETG